MKTFLGKVLPIMTTGLDLMHYQAFAGYLDKPGDKRECGVMQDVRIVCTSAEGRNAVVARLQTLAKTIEEREVKEKTGVYTWLACSSIDDDKSLRLYARYRDRKAMEKSIRTREVLDFWAASKDDIAQMESRAYLPNGKGWLHR